MKYFIKHKLLPMMFAVASIAAVMSLSWLPQAAYAAGNPCADPTGGSFTSACCPKGQSAVVLQGDGTCCPSDALSKANATTDGAKAKVCFFSKYLNPVVNLLSAVVGVVVVIGIVIGAIQYTSSAGDPQKAANGKNHIRNALLGLLAYIFLYAFLQFMIPGGSLN